MSANEHETLSGWRLDAPEHHPETKDGSCMGGPTPGFYRVWATRLSDGEVTLGRGQTPEEARQTAIANAEKKDAVIRPAGDKPVET